MPKQCAERLTYTTQEAMEKITVSRNWFYGAVKRGDIPSIKIGRKILIPKKAFDELFNGSSEETADA